MFEIIAIVVVLLAAVLIYAATKPGTFRIQRATRINAPAEKIFAILNDFQRWVAWSPYEKKDPDMKRTYSGAANGRGAVYAFEGNRQIGAGRLEITDASPPSRVALTLDMIKPFACHNLIEFTLEAHGDVTNVTWAMNGASPYFAKVMTMFCNMDSMVGKDFEAGLASLKTVAEK